MINVFDGLLYILCIVWEVKNDMSGQSKDALRVCNVKIRQKYAKYVYHKSDVRDTNLESEATNANGVRIVTRHPWWGFKLIPAHYQSQLDFVPESETGEISKVPYFWAGWVES